MTVTVHGVPGWSLDNDGAAVYGSAARRGAYYERLTAHALEVWLKARSDHFHLFHDLTRLQGIPRRDQPPLDLGDANIDHLVLTGAAWLIIDTKGCGAGTLGVRSDGSGTLERPDGTEVLQPWLDDRHAYSRAGVPYWLTEEMGGATAWIVPDATAIHPSIENAGCLKDRHGERAGGCVVLPMRAIADGYFKAVFPHPQPVARAHHIDRIAAYLSINQLPSGRERLSDAAGQSGAYGQETTDSGT